MNPNFIGIIMVMMIALSVVSVKLVNDRVASVQSDEYYDGHDHLNGLLGD